MNWKKKTCLVIVAPGGLILCGFLRLIAYINLPKDRTLAKNLKVTEIWTEIEFEKSLTAEYRSQWVALNIDGIDWDSGFDGVHMTNGKILHPKIELVDEQDTIQPLRLAGLSRKYSIDADFRAVNGTTGFSNGRKFTKLRIRSDIPFDCRSISWVDYNPP